MSSRSPRPSSTDLARRAPGGPVVGTARLLAKRAGLTARAGVLVACTAALFACAGHSARTLEARHALDARNPERALELYNEELEVDSKSELPKDVGGDNSLLLLDRSLILQQLGDYALSSRDLEVADKQIEMLDFRRSTADEIGKYLFSDDTGPYRAPPYEKLMINTMNMINYLAKGDLSGGRIEARRFTVMQDYLKDSDSSAAAMLGAGSYLAGFIFEKSNEAQTALRYYDEALQYGEFRTLDEAIVRLAARASYRTPRITKVLERHGVKSGEAPSPTQGLSAPETPGAEETSAEASGASDTAPAPAPAETEGTGEVLVILAFGRVPARVAERVPIGLALTYASGALSPTDRAKANALAAQGLVTWVNYPRLDKARGGYEVPSFRLSGEVQALDGVPIDKHTIAAWEETKGTVVASAITRMITRVVAGEAARQATGEGIEGLLVSLATQATLTAADTPDTRSWSTLPARVAFGRVSVPAGRHQVRIAARGQVVEKSLDVKPGGWATLNLTVLR